MQSTFDKVSILLRLTLAICILTFIIIVPWYIHPNGHVHTQG